MAFNKAKALQEAHKYVTQGKNALAIRQYLSILEHDPSDLILLNTIGDLYVREKNLPEGLKHFYKLADAHAQEGFVVKAIAIYKKIAKIDHNTAEPSLKLAELYLTQGLAREAHEQCTNAFEFYRTTNQQEYALEVLQKLARMDPDNPRRHLQLAQYAESAGKEQQAAKASLEAAALARQQGDALTSESALRRAAELFPNDPELEPFLAQQAFNQQHPEPGRVPQEFDLTQSSLDLAGPAGKDAVPSARELPSRLETSEEAPPFNTQEYGEEIDFYLAHGFCDEAQKAIRNLEARYPGETEVAALRRRVDEAQQKIGEQTPDAPEELPNPSPGSSTAERPRDAAVHLAAQLGANLGDLQEPVSRPLTEDATAKFRSAPQNADEASAELSGLLDELQEDEAAERSQEDPETHYNLGVAFLEMGLHDEAIGEFQKVVKGVDPDHFPPNFLQACTLLAASFTEKGMPSIAAQWYSRALEIAGLNEDAVLALRYDLGAALEQAGECKSALENFTQVYGQNIDYRDVVEKIRILRGKAP